MPVAPSRRSTFQSAAITGTPSSATVTITAGEVVSGDLIVVMWTSTAAPTNGGAAASLGIPTAKFGATTCATLREDGTVSDGTRVTYVWSGICTTSPGGSAVTITLDLTGITTSGTRRLVACSVNPGTGQRWDADRVVRTAIGTTSSGTAVGGGTSQWTTPWSAATAITNPEFPVMAYVQSTSNTQGLDWTGGTTFTVDTSPGTSANQHFWAASGYATPDLASVSNIRFAFSAAQTRTYVGILYATANPVQARANSASKATGGFTIIRRSSGRGNTADQSTGYGSVYTGIRSASGRAYVASSAKGSLRPKTAGGIARTAADSFTSNWGHLAKSQGRGRAASKSVGKPRLYARITVAISASSSTLTAAATRVATGNTATLGSASSALSASAVGIAPCAATLPYGSSSLSATGLRTTFATAALAGEGVMDIAGSGGVGLASAQAALSATAVLTSTAIVCSDVAPTLESTSTLVATGATVALRTSALSGVSGGSTSPVVVKVTTAALGGTSDYGVSEPVNILTASAPLSASVTLEADGGVNLIYLSLSSAGVMTIEDSWIHPIPDTLRNTTTIKVESGQFLSAIDGPDGTFVPEAATSTTKVL